LSNRAEKVTWCARGQPNTDSAACSVRIHSTENGAAMTAQDRDYFMLRARQEDEAALMSTSRTVRCRHEELGWLYRMRVEFDGREDLVVRRG
jgi:hypothetical protein